MNILNYLDMNDKINITSKYEESKMSVGTFDFIFGRRNKKNNNDNNLTFFVKIRELFDTFKINPSIFIINS